MVRRRLAIARHGVAWFDRAAVLAIYVGCLAFGGVLLGASLVGGGGDAEGHDAAGSEPHTPGHGHHHHGPAHTPPLPFLSLRFWLFALATFGLTGTLATLAGVVGVATPIVAGIAGLTSGWGATRLFARASRAIGLVAGADAHVGREGRLLLPVARGQRGKLRLEIGGATVDLVAETDGDVSLPLGAPALVVGLRGTVALIEPVPTTPRLPASSSSPAPRSDGGNKEGET